jgi:hypothetical protein
VTQKKGHRCTPAKKGTHDQIWTAVVTGVFMILAEVLQHLLAGWPLLGH